MWDETSPSPPEVVARAGPCAYMMSPTVTPRLCNLEILLVLAKRFTGFLCCLCSLYMDPVEIFQSLGISLFSWTVPWLGQPGGQNPQGASLQSRKSLNTTCLAYMGRARDTLRREAPSPGWLTA